jgi:hypothetical protein
LFSEDRLRVGRGPIAGSQTFMHLPRMESVAHIIQFVGFSTGYGNSGIWQLHENQGKLTDIFI